MLKPRAPTREVVGAGLELVETGVEAEAEAELALDGVAVAVAVNGAVAERVWSQTSSGSTSANSRSTRSQATRFESARLSAVTRACLSATRASCCYTWLWVG